MLELQNEIRNLILKLDHLWFLERKLAFQRDEDFQPFLDNIRFKAPILLPVYDQYGNQINEQIEDREINVSLNQYSWSNFIPARLTNPIYDNVYDTILVSQVISNNVLESISSFTKEIKDTTVVASIVFTSLNTIRDSVGELTKHNSDQQYISALDYFLEKINNQLEALFKKPLELFAISNTINQNLKFNLNQEELGALLLILYRAGFIYASTPNDTSFLNFCVLYFEFKNQRVDNYTKATFIRNRFNEAKNPCVARDKIIRDLLEAIENL